MADQQQRQVCPHCQKPGHYGVEDSCRACYYPRALMATNLQIAKQQAAAVEARYREAKGRAAAKGLERNVTKLEEAAEGSAVVVNVDIGLAHTLFVQDHFLYAPYEKQVAAGVRAPAAHPRDRRRRAVGSLLYGTASEEIVYGALSGDGRGLTSYGSVHIRLDEATIAYRSTILEENSYTFMEVKEVTPATPLPEGCLACWQDRGKLAVARLADGLRDGMGATDLRELLLWTEGKRETDKFLEVHIYGTFNRDAVQSVVLPQDPPGSMPLDLVESVQLKALQQRLDSLAVSWSEA